MVEHRHTHRAGLCRQRQAAVRGKHRSEGGGQPYRWIGIEHAQTVWPEDPDAVRPSHVDHLRLQLVSVLTSLGEPRGEYDRGAHTGRARLRHHRGHVRRRHHDHHQVHRPRHGPQCRVRRHTGDLIGVGVHRVDLTGEPVLHQCPKRLVADPLTPEDLAQLADLGI